MYWPAISLNLKPIENIKGKVVDDSHAIKHRFAVIEYLKVKLRRIGFLQSQIFFQFLV